MPRPAYLMGARNEGPAPFASFDDISMASFELSSPEDIGQEDDICDYDAAFIQDDRTKIRNNRSMGYGESYIGDKILVDGCYQMGERSYIREVFAKRCNIPEDDEYIVDQHGQQISTTPNGQSKPNRKMKMIDSMSIESSQNFGIPDIFGSSNKHESAYERIVTENRQNNYTHSGNIVVSAKKSVATDTDHPIDGETLHNRPLNKSIHVQTSFIIDDFGGNRRTPATLTPSNNELQDMWGSSRQSRQSNYSNVSGGSNVTLTGRPNSKIETSFCGRRILPDISFDVDSLDGGGLMNDECLSTVGSLSNVLDDSSSFQRSMYEEIRLRMQYPQVRNTKNKMFQKQDSYENAVSMKRGDSRRERQMQIAITKNKQVLKQDSYSKAIGGTFEEGMNSDDFHQYNSPKVTRKICKDDSYTRAIGGTFEETSYSDYLDERIEHPNDSSPRETCVQDVPPTVRLRKKPSYIFAVESGGPSHKLSKRNSYMQAIDSMIDNAKDCKNPYIEVLDVARMRIQSRVHHPNGLRQRDSYARAMNVDGIGESNLPNYDRVLQEFEKNNFTHKRQDSYLTALSDEMNVNKCDHLPDDVRSQSRKGHTRKTSYSSAMMEAAKDDAENDSGFSIEELTASPKRNSRRTKAGLHETKDAAAKVIQRYYRRFKKCENEKANRSALIIQARFRSYMDSKMTETSTKQSVYSRSSSSEMADDDMISSELSDAEENAARLTQQTFRKYKNDAVDDKRPREKNLSELRGIPSIVMDNWDLELETAATTIQQVYRRHLNTKIAASKMQQSRNIKNENTKFPVKRHVFKLKQNRNSEHTDVSSGSGESTSGDSNDDPKICEAATTLQAAYRGYRERKLLMQSTDNVGDAESNLEAELPMEDPSDLAARKIQCLFRKHINKKRSARKSVQTDDSSSVKSSSTSQSDVSSDSTGMNHTSTCSASESYSFEITKAAIKIQAIYRGFQVRRLRNNKLSIPNRVEEINLSESNEPSEISAPETDDKDLERSAIKIQSVYRGFKIRKMFNIPETEQSVVDVKGDVSVGDSSTTGISGTGEDKETKSTEPSSISSSVKYSHSQTSSDSSFDSEELKAALKIQPSESSDDTSKSMVNDDEVGKAVLLIQSKKPGAHPCQTSCKEKFDVKSTGTELPNSKEISDILKEPDDESKGIKIQSAVRCFNARKRLKAGKRRFKSSSRDEPGEATESSDDNTSESIENDDEVGKAAILIQSIYRGFKVRQRTTKKGDHFCLTSCKEKSDVKPTETESPNSREMSDILKNPDDESKIIKIQSAVRGFNARKRLEAEKRQFQSGSKDEPGETTESSDDNTSESIGNDDEVGKAVILIQSIYRGFKVRQRMTKTGDHFCLTSCKEKSDVKSTETELPNSIEISDILEKPDYESKIIKIQSAVRGFNARKRLEAGKRQFQCGSKDKPGEATESSDDNTFQSTGNDDEVGKAAILIQSIYRGFNVRQRTTKKGGHFCLTSCKEKSDVKSTETESPNSREMSDILKNPDDESKIIKIQSAVRGFNARKRLEAEKLQFQSSSKDEPGEATKACDQLCQTPLRENHDIKSTEIELPNSRGISDILDKPEDESKVIKIQSAVRGFNARKRYEAEKRQQVEAAGKIQSEFRQFESVKEEDKREQNVVSETCPDQQGSRTDRKLRTSEEFEKKMLQKMNSVSIGKIVDERDFKTQSSIEQSNVSLSGKSITDIIIEDKEAELLRHAGDVVGAAFTIQRFFRRCRRKKTSELGNEVIGESKSKTTAETSSSSNTDECEKLTGTEANVNSSSTESKSDDVNDTSEDESVTDDESDSDVAEPKQQSSRTETPTSEESAPVHKDVESETKASESSELKSNSDQPEEKEFLMQNTPKEYCVDKVIHEGDIHAITSSSSSEFEGHEEHESESEDRTTNRNVDEQKVERDEELSAKADTSTSQLHHVTANNYYNEQETVDSKENDPIGPGITFKNDNEANLCDSDQPQEIPEVEHSSWRDMFRRTSVQQNVVSVISSSKSSTDAKSTQLERRYTLGESIFSFFRKSTDNTLDEDNIEGDTSAELNKTGAIDAPKVSTMNPTESSEKTNDPRPETVTKDVEDSDCEDDAVIINRVKKQSSVTQSDEAAAFLFEEVHSSDSDTSPVRKINSPQAPLTLPAAPISLTNFKNNSNTEDSSNSITTIKIERPRSSLGPHIRMNKIPLRLDRFCVEGGTERGNNTSVTKFQRSKTLLDGDISTNRLRIKLPGGKMSNGRYILKNSIPVKRQRTNSDSSQSLISNDFSTDMFSLFDRQESDDNLMSGGNVATIKRGSQKLSTRIDLK